MSRPGFVIETDARTPSLLTMAGSRLSLARLGVGTKVVYPAESMLSSNPIRLIDQALEAPVGSEPLAKRLQSGTRLTVVVLDDERPSPRMRFDVRRSLVERVLEIAARGGVDDVAIVVAGGLGKRWSPYDMTRVLGDRVATSFQPDGRIESHDVTADDLVPLGEVDGHTVRLNRRVAESDLVVVVGAQHGHVPATALTGGLFDVETHRRLGGVSATEPFALAVAQLVAGSVEAFTLRAVLGQPYLHGLLGFATKREWEWGIGDRLSFVAARQAGALAPRTTGRLLHAAPHADYEVLDVVAGEPATANAEAAAVWQAANAIEVVGSADVVVIPVWAGSLADQDPVGSPINAAHEALVRRLGSHLGTPLLRPGGVVIAMHPLEARFSNRRQSAASDFFAKVLPTTIDPAEMGGFDEAACNDEWYASLYRKQFADHPLRTFQTWYRVARATQGASDVIWVGGNRRTADLFGHRAATTYGDALELASNTVGRTPSITVLHGPGLPLGDVR